VTAGLEIAPLGPFSLRAAAGFGFGFTSPAAQFDGTMRLAFATDDLRHHAGVLLRQDAGDGVLHAEVQGGGDLDAVRAQVARILSLEHDGRAWVAVGAADPVIGRLQAEHPGLRPVLFHSPYEAAAWSIISARRPAAQAAVVRRELCERLGATFELGGDSVAAFPLPQRLLAADELPGLPAEKVARLRAVADEPRSLASAAHFYELDGPPDRAAFAEPWRPFRTWATVLLRVAGERAGVSRRG
jgi:DNA-3-methyladenine glycosylase II